MSVNNSLYQRHLSSAREAKAQATKLQAHPSYQLAFTDDDFLMQDELRHVRLQLEYLKAQTILEQHQIKATIVVFGSARFVSPEQARYLLAQAQQQLAQQPDDACRPTSTGAQPNVRCVTAGIIWKHNVLPIW